MIPLLIILLHIERRINLLLIKCLHVRLRFHRLITRLQLLVHALGDLIDKIWRNLHVSLIAALKHRLDLLLHELLDQFVLIRLLNCWL